MCRDGEYPHGKGTGPRGHFRGEEEGQAERMMALKGVSSVGSYSLVGLGFCRAGRGSEMSFLFLKAFERWNANVLIVVSAPQKRAFLRLWSHHVCHAGIPVEQRRQLDELERVLLGRGQVAVTLLCSGLQLELGVANLLSASLLRLGGSTVRKSSSNFGIFNHMDDRYYIEPEAPETSSIACISCASWLVPEL